MEPNLIFPPTWQLDSFTTNVTSRQAGDPDPVVRELLQNSLDAAIREAEREFAEIHFTIATRPLRDLPGHSAYVNAFRSAKKELKPSITYDVQSAVDRVDSVLQRQEMSVLFCRDNGTGLDADRMKALLSEGQSDKATQGAGSFGLGHLTAYAASDLRYVLYAGKRDGKEVASGHAILASHKRKGKRRSAHGYWRTPTDLFSLEDGNFPTVAPPLLREQIDQIDSSGSIVAIAGFNYFHEEQPDVALEDICRVAALNFLGAIWERKMIVHVHDEATGHMQTVDTDSLQSLLEPIRNQQRAPIAGWLSGEQGYRAWQTLADGKALDTQIDRSVRVIVRPLGGNASERSRVQIFRDGMWITNREPELASNAFGGVQPFDAVVLLTDADPEDHTEFYDLVRKAEGPEHRGLTKRRELPKSEKKTLGEMLSRVAERLREEAGAIDADEGFTPVGFAVFNAGASRQATPVPRLRYRPAASETGPNEAATDSKGGDPDGPPTPDREGKGTKKPHRRRAPASGTAVRIRRTLVPQLDADGLVRKVRAQLKVIDPEPSSTRAGLRLFIESGSDETCEQPLSPVWQPIRSVTIDGTTIDGGDETEVAIPWTAEEFEIELGEPVLPSARFELDAVRRKSKESGK